MMRKRLATLLLALLPSVLPAAGLDLGGIRPEEAAVYVQNLRTGQITAAHRADAPVNPASTMKLVTAFAALHALGEDFRWQTEFKSAAPLRPNGLLDGALYWAGSGDPVFDQHDLLEMQAQLRDNGVKHIGRLVFDRNLWPHGGTADDFADDSDRAFTTPPDPQMLAYKVVGLTIGRDEGGALTVHTSPPLPEIPLDNRASFTASAAPCPKPAKFVWGKYENGILTVYGKAPPSCLGKEVYVNMFDAQDFARRSFINQWRHGGNSISDGLAVGPVPPQARTLARIRSKPLRDVLADMNKHSNNIIARTIFLTLGERAAADKARQNPEAAVRSRLTLSGIPTAPLVLENGSGLSRRERVSARMMGDMLAAAYRSPFKQAFIGSLPIAGRDGTLKSRFKNIGSPLRLKTGTLKNVRALAGYYLGGDGSDPLAVVVIINSERADKLLGEMDKLTERLIAPAPPSDGLTPGAANP